MKELEQIQLYKNRSYTACIAEAHKIFFTNLKTIIQKTWLYAIATAFAVALYAYFHIDISTNDYGGQMAWGYFASIIILLTAIIVLLARIMYLANGKTMKYNIIRSVKASIIYIVVLLINIIGTGFIYYKVSGGTMMIDNIDSTEKVFALSIGLFIILNIIMLPITYISVKYFMEPESKLHRIFFKSYIVGIRHWGLLFITWMIISIIITSCCILASMPAIVILIAKGLSAFGENFIGDLSGLPAYFDILTFATFTFTSFICIYINVFAFLVYYLIYGSIEAREKGREDFLKRQI
ncbi:MAG: hypothetical protein ACI4V5_06730 [Prevotella sp.]